MFAISGVPCIDITFAWGLRSVMVTLFSLPAQIGSTQPPAKA